MTFILSEGNSLVGVTRSEVDHFLAVEGKEVQDCTHATWSEGLFLDKLVVQMEGCNPKMVFCGSLLGWMFRPHADYYRLGNPLFGHLIRVLDSLRLCFQELADVVTFGCCSAAGDVRTVVAGVDAVGVLELVEDVWAALAATDDVRLW